ncbi:hypothetical protein RI054_02g06900 [Pseudoscourfieldia marina]
MAKELAQLAPWGWDPRITKHPPGPSSLRHFEEAGALAKFEKSNSTNGKKKNLKEKENKNSNSTATPNPAKRPRLTKPLPTSAIACTPSLKTPAPETPAVLPPSGGAATTMPRDAGGSSLKGRGGGSTIGVSSKRGGEVYAVPTPIPMKTLGKVAELQDDDDNDDDDDDDDDDDGAAVTETPTQQDAATKLSSPVQKPPTATTRPRRGANAAAATTTTPASGEPTKAAIPSPPAAALAGAVGSDLAGAAVPPPPAAKAARSRVRQPSSKARAPSPAPKRPPPPPPQATAKPPTTATVATASNAVQQAQRLSPPWRPQSRCTLRSLDDAPRDGTVRSYVVQPTSGMTCDGDVHPALPIPQPWWNYAWAGNSFQRKQHQVQPTVQRTLCTSFSPALANGLRFLTRSVGEKK